MKKTTLPLFLALWAVMMLILGALKCGKAGDHAEGVMETARQDVERDYQEIWSGGAAEVQRPRSWSGGGATRCMNTAGRPASAFTTPRAGRWTAAR